MTHEQEQPMMSVRAFAAQQGFKPSEEDLARWDRELEAHCRSIGIPIGKEYTLTEAQMDALQTGCVHEGMAQAWKELGAHLLDLDRARKSGASGTTTDLMGGLIMYVMEKLEVLGVVSAPDAASPLSAREQWGITAAIIDLSYDAGCLTNDDCRVVQAALARRGARKK